MDKPMKQGEHVAIDYQKVLMDMNRPRRRQGSAWKKLLVVVVILAVLGGGVYGVWRYELAAKAWTGVSSLVAKVFGRQQTGEAGEEASANESLAMTQAPAQAQPQSSIRPEPVQSMRPPASVVHANDGPIDVASQSSSVPRLAVPPTSASLSPAPSAAAASRAAVAAPIAQNTQQPQSQAAVSSRPSATPAARNATRDAGPGMASTPILSEAKAQIRVIDGMLASDPGEALRRIEDLIASTRLEPDDAAEAGYRRGYAARLLRDESLAESSWRETADKYPTLRGGRFSALALADTWYHRYAGERPQLSYWDDVQAMYSRTIGVDDAPFLPENVKAAVKLKLNRLNDSLFFGSAPSKMARYHKVEPGELLGSIAQKYRVDYESIARINGIDPNRIRVGMDLKLVVGEVSIVVRKNEQNRDKGPTITWFLDGRWMREYASCVGEGVKTPAGTYNLTSKERDPSWTNPANGQLLPNNHPENILGSRWMAMKGMNTQGLGIHGTTVDDSIPGYTSAGCIRLLDKNVEELFSYARIGNKVTVLD